MLDKEYMTPGEVCDYLQISRWTLNDLVKRGKFVKPLRISNQLKRWSKADLDLWEKEKSK